MSTNRDIVRRALRKLGALASGSNPSDAEAQDALEVLQSHYLTAVDLGSLGRLRDMIATADLTAPENTRIRVNAGVVVTLPLIYGQSNDLPSPYPLDWEFQDYWGDGCYGPRPPINQSVVVLVDNLGVQTVWMYKAEAGAWVKLSAAALNDDFPFSEGMANGFAAWLAVSLAPEYGQQVDPAVAKDATTLSVALTHRYDNAYRPNHAEYI